MWRGWEKEEEKMEGLAQVSVDRPATSDTLSPRLTLVQQLVLSGALSAPIVPILPIEQPHTCTQMRFELYRSVHVDVYKVTAQTAQILV